MNVDLRIGQLAKEDLREARQWYASQKPGLDLDFRDELDLAFGRIRSFPEGYPVVYRDVRRAVLRRFPYSVFYYRKSAGIWFVLAIIHQARHPSHWQRRRSQS